MAFMSTVAFTRVSVLAADRFAGAVFWGLVDPYRFTVATYCLLLWKLQGHSLFFGALEKRESSL